MLHAKLENLTVILQRENSVPRNEWQLTSKRWKLQNIYKHNKVQVSTASIIYTYFLHCRGYFTKPKQLRGKVSWMHIKQISERTLSSIVKILHYFSNKEISLSWSDTSQIPKAAISETKRLSTRNIELPKHSQNQQVQWPMFNSTLSHIYTCPIKF